MPRQLASEGSVTFRLERSQRERLHELARKAGLSTQAYFEQCVFGEIFPRSQGGRPRKLRQDEELPLSKSA